MVAHRHSGFTLIELMVALVVLGILTAIAGPSFVEYLERYRIRSAAEDTLALFVQARQGAVEADRNVRLLAGGVAPEWCIGAIQVADPAPGQLVSGTATCDCTKGATDPAACTVGSELLAIDGTARSGVTLTTTPLPDFSYDSKGGTLADLSTTPQIDFVSSSGRYGLSVRVSALGQARACTSPGKQEIPGFPPC